MSKYNDEAVCVTNYVAMKVKYFYCHVLEN